MYDYYFHTGHQVTSNEGWLPPAVEQKALRALTKQRSALSTRIRKVLYKMGDDARANGVPKGRA